jgi:DNA-binding CsgD family transcriptional regulator
MALIGREADLEMLRSALAECDSSRAGIVKIEGSVGCGKSELLEAFAASSSTSGRIVLRAAGHRTDSSQPLGVVKQLIESGPLPEATAGNLRQLLCETEADSCASARVVHIQRFCAEFHRVLRDRPVLIAVDDLQHVDALSMRYLLYLADRSRSMRLLMVFTEVLNYRQWDTRYRTELIRQSNFQRIRIGCLGHDEVAALLAEGGGETASERTVDSFYQVTGGNPLLLRALQEDHLATAAQEQPPAPEATASTAFAHAILTCLDRSGPSAALVAEALAVLGEASTNDLMARLCELPHPHLAQGLEALRTAGVIDGLRFRHRAAVSAVLQGMDQEYRRRLHYRAASLLYADGAPATAAAAHLRAAASAEGAWVVRVLRDAAEEVLADDQDRLASEYLSLAHRSCADASQRFEIRLRTAVIMRRNDPFAAERVSEELLADMRSGTLNAQQCAGLVKLLLVLQRMGDAVETFAALRELNRDAPPGTAVSATELRQVAAECYDACVGPGIAEAQSDGKGWSATRDRDRDRQQLLPWPFLDTAQDIAEWDEELLEYSVLTDSTVDAIRGAIKRLIYAGRMDQARYWAETAMKEAAQRDASGWYALFAGLRAGIAFLEGRMPDMERIARSGRDRINGQRGGLTAHGLTGLQLIALTAMGNYSAGAHIINQSVPQKLLRGSAFGLTYLRGRGRYYLATNRLNVALDDFLAVGEMSRKWDYDDPGAVPWRGDVAEVMLRFDKREEAARLLHEQLALLDSSHAPDLRTRGITLRQLAATADLPHRLTQLNSSVGILQSAGDRLELAYTLYDLAETHRRLGESAQAAMVSRRAWQLAEECGAKPLSAKLRFVEDGEIRAPAESIAPQPDTAGLSESEKQVAILAACGHSNRDISAQLFITVSTVEQHLTRVYRKLKIAGRKQLPVDLRFEAPQITLRGSRSGRSPGLARVAEK